MARSIKEVGKEGKNTEKGTSFSKTEATTEDNFTLMKSMGWEPTAGKTKKNTKESGSITRCQEKVN